MSQNYGLLVKDLSNTDIDYLDYSNTERNTRHNAILQLLTSEKSPTFSSDLYNSGTRTIQGWNVPSYDGIVHKVFLWMQTYSMTNNMLICYLILEVVVLSC